jgi:hypothetical protein
MKIEINVNKVYFMFTLFFILLIVGSLVVYAWGTNNPSVFGHSSGEIIGALSCSQGQALSVDSNGWKCVDVGLSEENMGEIGGNAVCVLNANELVNLGCPDGSYLFRVVHFTNGRLDSAAYCKLFFSKDQLPEGTTCYDRSSPGGSEPACRPCHCSGGTLSTGQEYHIC